MSNPTLVAFFEYGPFLMILASSVRLNLVVIEFRPTGNPSGGWRFCGINCWRYLPITWRLSAI